jgi:Zn finger protein HypA/HybF involved in hydrogenase expression
MEMNRYGDPEKFAIDYLIKNEYKLKEDYNNFAGQVVKIAIEALEKQIAKKAKSTGMKFKALDVETKEVVMYECSPCPSCEKWLSKIYKYCPHCGQRIEED